MLSYALSKASQHNSGGRYSVYAVAVDKRGRIVAEAGNNYGKSSTLQAKYAKKVGRDKAIFLHAEMALIAKMLRLNVDVKGVTVYVARANKQGKPMKARPCQICEMGLKEAGITNIVWTEGKHEL